MLTCIDPTDLIVLMSRNIYIIFSVQVTLVQTARALPVLNKVTTTRKFSTKVASEEEFDRKYVDYFNRPDIDGWEIRKGMADLVAMDLVPEPEIVAAALRACRRVNDFSLTTRSADFVSIKRELFIILICQDPRSCQD